MEEIKVDFNRIWINSICFSTDIGFSKANKKRTCWDKKVIKSIIAGKKSYRFRTFYHIFIRSRDDDVPPFLITLLFMAIAGKQNVCVWFCVCMRYWMDSIYNWMFLSSLTIILPSMTTFFNLFAALNGYYFCFCLFYIAMFFCPVLPCCELLY